MMSTMYAPQRVNYKPTAPPVDKLTDPKQVLLASLKKLMDKKQQKTKKTMKWKPLES